MRLFVLKNDFLFQMLAIKLEAIEITQQIAIFTIGKTNEINQSK